MDDVDYYEKLVVCNLCEDYYCLECDTHWADCGCPGPMSEEEPQED
tara:strand:- start:48 stop:185 length:138 start_codon:yes stop_codon:yes gene_type:complete